MANRTLFRAASAIGAFACLAWAAWLAFDWADYGSDSTCGNFIRYKGAGGTCAHIMRGRVVGAIALVAVAVVLLGIAWALRRSSAESD